MARRKSKSRNSILKVILLDHSYIPIGIIPLKKAMKLLAKKRVEVVKDSDVVLHQTKDKTTYVPVAVRLLRAIAHFFKRHIPWSKHNVFIRDNFTCQYCGDVLPRSKCTVDHVIPQDRGGKNEFRNTVCACFGCNNIKDNRTPDEAGMPLLSTPRTPSVIDLINTKFKDFDLKSLWDENKVLTIE